MKKFLYRDGYKVKYLLTFASAKKHYLPSRLFFLFFWIEMSAFIPIKRLTLCHINTLVSAQGTESTVMTAAGVVDEISYANAAADQQSHILIPLYGPEGIQGGVVGYKDTAIEFAILLGSIAAGLITAPITTGWGKLALGIGVITSAINPALDTTAGDIAAEVFDFIAEKFHFNLQCKSNGKLEHAADALLLLGTSNAGSSTLILDLDNEAIKVINKTAGIHVGQGNTLFSSVLQRCDGQDGLLIFDDLGHDGITSGNALFLSGTTITNTTASDPNQLRLWAEDENKPLAKPT